MPLVWRVQPRVSLESAWLIATFNVSPSSGQIFKSHVDLINKADAQNIFYRFTFVDLKPVKICVPVHWVCAQQCGEWPEALVAHEHVGQPFEAAVDWTMKAVTPVTSCSALLTKVSLEEAWFVATDN